MTIDEARKILNKESGRLTNNEISNLVQLVDISLDQYETGVFGRTISELIILDCGVQMDE